MPSVPSKVGDRLIAGLKRFQPILSSAQARDVNESDTVIIITDMLAEVFGYDKYSELTSENAIRGTYCDLAIKVEGALQFLIEAKAINQELKDAYVKQAIDYAANQGVDWVILTNGILWRVYKVAFTKPIDQELVFEFNFTSLNARTDESVETLFRITKEGCAKSVLGEFYSQKQALNRFCVAAMILSEPVLALIRRELKKLSPDVKIDQEQIRNVLEHEVFKREVVEGDKAEDARKKIARSVSRSSRNRSNKEPEVAPVASGEAAPMPVQEPCGAGLRPNVGSATSPT